MLSEVAALFQCRAVRLMSDDATYSRVFCSSSFAWRRHMNTLPLHLQSANNVQVALLSQRGRALLRVCQ